MQQTATLSRKGRRMAAKAEAKARKAAAQEAAEEAAVQAAVEAAQEATRLKPKRNIESVPTCTVTIKAVSPSKKGALQTADTLGESPEENQIHEPQEHAAGKSMSKQAIKNRRKRANRRARRAEETAFMKQATKDEDVSMSPVSVGIDSTDAVTTNEDTPIDKNIGITVVKNAVLGEKADEVHEADQPKWLRGTAHLVWIESREGKEHEFYQGEELDTHEKVHCVLNSIQNENLSHDGFERQVYPENWRDWEELHDPCNGIKGASSHKKTFIHELPFTPFNTQAASFYQTVDENLQYHTFTSEGVPYHTAQMLAWCEAECGRCTTLDEFEAYIEERKLQFAKYCGVEYGADGNPWAETLSSVELGGVVYRGKPRTIQIHVLAPEGSTEDGTIAWTYRYTRTMLAYKSFYRVMSTVDKDMYHYGGEHLFYRSGQAALHLRGNLQPDTDAIQEFAYI